MSLPQVLVTGSSGFLGRHLLEALKNHYRIFGIARRSPAATGAPLHRNIEWLQVDIRDRATLKKAFRRIRDQGGIERVIHLAAHYDFTGEPHPDYQRTNVDGLRNILDECRAFDLRQFVFASSVAACEFRHTNRMIDEDTPADGAHYYAISKRLGEAMLEEYADDFPSCTIRFAALFSDWCEYPPLFKFLETWLSTSWRRRVIGSRGSLAIPYLHVQDAVRFLLGVMKHEPDIAPGEVFIASADAAVSVQQLFDEATLYYFGREAKPIHLPKVVCAVGMFLQERTMALLGSRPFERAWMASYFDCSLDIDPSRTRQRLEWVPRERLTIRRRLPFMIENLKCEPVEWYRRNHMAMRMLDTSASLRVHHLLERHEREISEEMSNYMTSEDGRRLFPSYQTLMPEEREWNHRVALRHLLDSVRTRDKSIYGNFCRDLAELRFAQGFAAEEVRQALEILRDICLKTLLLDPDASELDQEIENHVMMTLLFGCDQVEDAFDHLRDQTRQHSAAVAE